MNFAQIRKLVAKCTAFLAIPVVALTLTNCGGGGEDSGGKMIAPASLDKVHLDFFSAFTLECSRLSGVAGNESGGCQYARLKSNFLIGNITTTGGLAITVDLPALLSNITYNYVRTGKDTGRVTITFINDQVYVPPADIGGDMFWGGPKFLATELVVDLLFTDRDGSIGSTTARVRSAYYVSKDAATVPPAPEPTYTVIPWEFDTTEVTFRLTSGGTVPSGYNPTFTASTPASGVWTTLQGRSVWFSGSDTVTRKVAHQSVGGSGPPLPGAAKIEETGAILIDCDAEGIAGTGGTYSYARTGGQAAKFAITYQKADGSTVTLMYDMMFNSLDGGTYVDSTGVSGTFLQDLYTAH